MEKPVCLTWKPMVGLSQTVAVDHPGISSWEAVWECRVLTIKIQIIYQLIVEFDHL